MKVAMVEEMRQIDKLAGEKYGIPEAILMENAGRAVAGVVVDELAGVAGKTICVLAGAGNNGGDAFVAARHLANHGAQVKVFLVGDTDKLTKSAAQNRDICQKMGITVQTLAAERDWEKFALLLKLADVIVDGLLGTGVKGPLRNPSTRSSKWSTKRAVRWSPSTSPAALTPAAAAFPLRPSKPTSP